MKALVITLEGNSVSERAAEICIASHKKFKMEFPIEKTKATTPEEVESQFKSLPFKWTYPWDTARVDIKSGLKLTPYTTADKNKRIACFLSHYHLWKKCVDENEPLLILEHDAVFIRPFFNYQYTINSNYGIIGINNPIGATRRADIFDNQIQTMRGSDLHSDGVVPVPTIDSFDIPQGLAGNSSYIIKPSGAKQLLNALKEHGAWPNDALMCKQILPTVLGVTKKYYTKVQGTRSTTTL